MRSRKHAQSLEKVRPIRDLARVLQRRIVLSLVIIFSPWGLVRSGITNAFRCSVTRSTLACWQEQTASLWIPYMSNTLRSASRGKVPFRRWQLYSFPRSCGLDRLCLYNMDAACGPLAHIVHHIPRSLPTSTILWHPSALPLLA
ncbi:hypothetical protein BOTBODRAFT_483281 [Botryobasidium botryosum FD-172 SS1]|uniref:Uncharacterized protein n=1 Tax=Botryobasidium botryosum (strain FD-172 SS1) TaxID=930990 RepID=A0A067MTJ9_BOTB1|nr:hypothetical protein BOTBODRAFT_483281 [Botryobasidium botryosum FD-172 SS1]